MAHFNKRHYEAIALVMQECNHGPLDREPDEGEYTSCEQWEETVHALAAMFQSDNRLFNAARFEHACNPGSNVKARTAHLKVVS